MATFPEAEARLYKNVYICSKTKRKVRLPIGKFLTGKFSTRKGLSKQLRPVRKKSK